MSNIGLCQDLQISSSEQIPTKKIAFLADSQDEYVDYLFDKIKIELQSLSKDRYPLQFMPVFYCDCNRQGIRDMFDRYLQDQSVDIIVCSGFLSSQVAREMAPLKKPVIVADLIEREIIPMPYDKGVSGVENFYYVDRKINIEEDIALFKKVAKVDTVYLLVEEKFAEVVQKTINDNSGVFEKAEIISVKANVQDILDKIDQVKPTSLFVTFIPLKGAEKDTLFEQINLRKIPTFALIGYFDVVHGALIGNVPEFGKKFARRIALTIDRVIKGENAGNISVDFDLVYRPILNQRTIRTLDIGVPFDVLLQAKVLYAEEEYDGDKMLTIEKAVEEAINNNWNFKIIKEQIEATRKSYYLQWTNYLPQVIGYLQYEVNDSERARYSSGSIAKDTFSVGATLNQLIFSDPVIWSIVNSRKQVDIEKLQKASTELNITEDTINTYLDFLRLKALKNVQMQNKTALEQHRKVAQAKYSLGEIGPEDIYRWDAEIAEKKTDIIDYDSKIRQARVNLNQLMNHALEDQFSEQDVGLETISYYIGAQGVNVHINSLKKVKMLVDVLVSQAIGASPEYEALEISIEQQVNNLTVSGNRFLLPEAYLEGDINNVASEKDYSGKAIRDENVNWDLTLKMTYPLFDRGSRPIDYYQQKNDLSRLRFQASLKKQLIEKDLRNAAYDLYFNLLAIDLRKEAMINSTKNYDIVVKRYDEGLANITDLINARNNKFTRESNAVIAVYDFLTALSSFNRQLSNFYIIATDEEKQAWWAEVEEKIQKYSA